MIVLIVNQPDRQTWFSGELQDLPMITSFWQGSSFRHPLRLRHVENLRILVGDQMMNDTHVKPRCIAGTARQIALFHKARGFESLTVRTFWKDISWVYSFLKQARDVDHFGKPFNSGYPTHPSNHSKSCGIMWYPFLYNRACDIDVHHVGTCNVLCVHQQPASSI